MSVRKTIAFFDFDGTITRKDTLFEFIKFTHGSSKLVLGMIAVSPWLIGLKAGMVSAATAKEKLLSHFYNGMQVCRFEELCRQFSENVLPSLIRQDAYEEILMHKKMNSEIIVVSASAENWIRYWCEKEGLKYLGTRLCVNGGRMTGKIEGFNCNGAEKVSRIKASFDPADYDDVYAYGDSKGDSEMLALSNHPYFRHFKL